MDGLPWDLEAVGKHRSVLFRTDSVLLEVRVRSGQETQVLTDTLGQKEIMFSTCPTIPAIE